MLYPWGLGSFAEKLGLNTVEGRAVLDVAFEGTGVGAKDITRFLEVAERAGSFVVRDPAQFVTRRVTLGGFKSLLLFGLGSSAGAFFGAGLAPLMVPFMLRYGSSILTDPNHAYVVLKLDCFVNSLVNCNLTYS